MRARLYSRNNDVCGHEQDTFEVIASSVQYQEIDHEDRDEERNGLEQVEVQTHALIHAPTQDDNNRGDEQGNLNTRSDGNTNGKIHLVLRGDSDGSNVLGGVTDDGQDNETNEGLTDGRVLNHTWNGIDEKFSTDCNKAGADQKHHNGSGAGHFRRFLVLFGINCWISDLTLGLWIGDKSRTGWPSSSASWSLSTSLIDTIWQRVGATEARRLRTGAGRNQVVVFGLRIHEDVL